MTKCDGCDDSKSDVRVYRAKFSGSEQWETVRYCGDCADLAGINWNGETDAIESWDADHPSGLYYVGDYDRESTDA